MDLNPTASGKGCGCRSKHSRIDTERHFDRPRVSADWPNSPLKFLNHPWELRNDISLLLSSEQRPDVGSPEETTCFDTLEYVMDQTSLFRTCRQMMNEGLGLLYKKHCFKFCVENGGCFLAILQWLMNIVSESKCLAILHLER